MAPMNRKCTIKTSTVGREGMLRGYNMESILLFRDLVLFHTPDTSRNLASFADLITLMDMKDSCYSALPTMAGASLTS